MVLADQAERPVLPPPATRRNIFAWDGNLGDGEVRKLDDTSSKR